MPHLSYWEKSIYFNETDVVIIGAGIVGLCTGISLLEKDPSLNVLILERNYISLGASTKNAGFACFGSPSELLEDLKSHDENKVFSLFKKRYDGIQKLMQYTTSYSIDFIQDGGFEVIHPVRSGIIYKQSDITQLNKKINDFTGLDNFFYFKDESLKTFQLKGFQHLIANDQEGCLHPVKMLIALESIYKSKGGKLLYGAPLVDWQEFDHSVQIVLADKTTFHSKQLIFCINGFANKLFPQLDVIAARNLVLLIQPENKSNLKGCFHMDRGYIYFRNVEGNLLIGGGRNLDMNQEFTDEFGSNELIKSYLLAFVKECIFTDQKFRIADQWSGILGLGTEKKPIIKMITGHTAVAVRMGGMGVAIGSLVGEEAAEMLLEAR